MSKNKKIVCFLEDYFEDLELWYPVLRLREAGYEVVLAAPEAGKTYHGKYGVPAESDKAFTDIDPEDFIGLLVPGGWAPDKIRRYDSALDIVKAMDKAEKPIGHICHAGWVLSSADILKGRHVTSTPGIKDDLIHAGATWSDEPAITDGHIISSRRPPDLPDYLIAYLEALEKYENK